MNNIIDRTKNFKLQLVELRSWLIQIHTLFDNSTNCDEFYARVLSSKLICTDGWVNQESEDEEATREEELTIKDKLQKANLSKEKLYLLFENTKNGKVDIDSAVYYISTRIKCLLNNEQASSNEQLVELQELQMKIAQGIFFEVEAIYAEINALAKEVYRNNISLEKANEKIVSLRKEVDQAIECYR